MWHHHSRRTPTPRAALCGTIHTGEKGTRRATQPEVCGSSTAVVGPAASVTRSSSVRREGCVAGAEAAVELDGLGRCSGRNWREVTSSYDRIECRNASACARAARGAVGASQRAKQISAARKRRCSPQRLRDLHFNEMRWDATRLLQALQKSPRGHCGLPMAQSGLLARSSKTRQ